MPTKAERALAAIEKARERRVAGALRSTIRTQTFINERSQQIKMAIASRVRLATNYLRDRVVINISVPVVKIVKTHSYKDPDTGRWKKVSRVVVDPESRSKPGEFPRADTTTLMKSIFADQRETSPGIHEGYVGTPLDYGLILETEMDRSFLVRTMNEERPSIVKILTGPIV